MQYILRFSALPLRALLGACLLLVVVSPLSAQVDPMVLKQIKDATVLIKSGRGDKASTGSGFVVVSDDKHTLVATNAHVIEPHVLPGTIPFVQCVFNSGQANERTLSGEIFSFSQVDDLALLKVYELKNVPKLAAQSDVVPMETQRVYAAGFPFGEMLSMGDRNPNLTVAETGVTSVRLGASGMPEMLQTSGGIDPGNSGGPVVDKEGRLVGISVAKIRESSIGFAIPAWKLVELLPLAMSDIVMSKKPEEQTFRFAVNLTGMRDSHHSSTPELLGARFPIDQQIATSFVDGSWTSIADLKMLRYSAVMDAPEVNFRRHAVHVDLKDLAGQGDQYVFQWRLLKGIDRQTRQKQYRFSRPLIVSSSDIENAMKGKSSSLKPEDVPEETVDEGLAAVKVFKFDRPILRCVPAGGGRYLVVRTLGEDIVVIDLETKEQVASVNDTKVDFLVAGLTSVVTFNRTDRSMTTYQLPDLKPLGTKPLRDGPIVRNADWGSQSNGPIAAVIQPSGAKTLSCVLIDHKTGKTSRIPLETARGQRGRNVPSFLDAMPTSGNFELRMNETGNVITLWLNNSRKPQVHVIRQGRRQWTHDYFTEGAAYGFAGPTGKRIYSADSVLADDLGLLHEASLCIPTMHDDYFLSLAEIQMSDPNAPRTGPTTSLDPNVKHVDNFTWQLSSVSEAKAYRAFRFMGDLNEETLSLGMEIDERFVCVPQYGVLAAVLPEAMRGSSKRLSLFSLGNRLPGVSDPEDSQAEQTDQPKPEQYRIWTDATGKHTLEATAVAVKQGYVKFQKRDGSTVVMQITKLSKPDQEILNSKSD
ncbi:MAG: trypsin-like peptidase domain-containing protein [Rubripirellula sp.]